MSKPELYGGIGSFVIGALFFAFPKLIGVRFNRISRSIWQGHEDDLTGKIRKSLPISYADNVDAKAPKTFRVLGIVFLIQAVVFFVLSAVM